MVGIALVVGRERTGVAGGVQGIMRLMSTSYEVQTEAGQKAFREAIEADPEFGQGRNCADYVSPAILLGPHVAPLGLAFYTGDMFPAEYHHQLFIAEHGSWNRSKKIGYRVKLVHFDEQGAVSGQEVFAQGWLQGENAWGRPNDVLVMPDGALLVSDDAADVVYRISYSASD